MTPGKYQDNRTEIVDGLQAGEYIVTFGYQDLADGQTLLAYKEKATAE